MAGFSISPSRSTGSLIGCSNPSNHWSKVHHAPWTAPTLVMAVLACSASSIYIVVVSDEQPVESWSVPPPVLFAALSSIINFSLGIAFSISIAIAWWRSALHGTTLASLHRIWSRGLGSGFSSFLLAGGFPIHKIILASAVVSVVRLINMQRATTITTQQIVTNETMLLEIAQRIPDGWAGSIENDTTDTIMTGSRESLHVAQNWWRTDTVSTRSTTGYYCHGLCEGRVQGAGVSYDCSSTTSTLDVSSSENNGATIFGVNTTRLGDQMGTPYLLLIVFYAADISEDCIATMHLDICKIQNSIVEYPVIIQNRTLILNYNELNSMKTVSTYTSAGDSLVAAPAFVPAGPLSALHHYLGNFFFANSTVFVVPPRGQIFEGASFISSLFSNTELSSYRNSSNIYEKCSFKWDSPTNYVLNSMHDYMFRAALQTGGPEYFNSWSLETIYNASHTQNFSVRRTSPSLLFHSNYGYFGAAIASILIAILAVISLLWGWWELDRRVSLSPLETAKAFGAPILQCDGRNSDVDKILKGVGQTRVRYDEYIAVSGNDDSEEDSLGIRYDSKIQFCCELRRNLISLRTWENFEQRKTGIQGGKKSRVCVNAIRSLIATSYISIREDQNIISLLLFPSENRRSNCFPLYSPIYCNKIQ